MIDRFASKIAWPSQMTACWLWTAKTDRDGYGGFHADGKDKIAHRVSYELFRGPIPAQLQIDHLCRVRNCVNPLHLEAVPALVNNLRSESPTAINAAKTRCVSGHEFTEANTYRWMRQGRVQRTCRACNAAAVRRAKARKKETVR